ncbi:tRNA-guanine transglycosylase DpdA [Myxococcota bacterium]
MKFFFPDSQDQIDPLFDFEREEHPPHRVRQRDDRYAHEIHDEPVYQGVLVSKAIVDGLSGVTGRYTLAQRHRLYRVGVREFFRLDSTKGPPLMTMGDCGAFTYVREEEPPYSVDEVIDFYEGCDFDQGVSIDHVILNYDASCDHSLPGVDMVPEEWRRRQELTFELATEFKSRHKARKCRFIPLGVAQGWSPKSYAHAVVELQRVGYKKIAIGGMVPLKTHEILDVLEAASSVRKPSTEFHLFGVTRCEHVPQFAAYGVTSFDSTSPFRKAFKDAKNNFYTPEKNYVALRVPQVENNPKLRRRIAAGDVDQAEAIRLEARCLERLRAFDAGKTTVRKTLNALLAYEELFEGEIKRRAAYQEVLDEQPWKQCGCAVCRESRIDVIVFRGSERNKRRGFHNLHVFAKTLAFETAKIKPAKAKLKRKRKTENPKKASPKKKILGKRSGKSTRTKTSGKNTRKRIT